ncbi:InlB B-repeat-containing protein [Velocimicrobium porci]|uniref:Uncharacterized protein n=1 Tax=Velocimicrobium porci TaxID=2606634 RepID=A0A6L5Y1D1_9FIRM|nr:InlB B-repeat-containing protein [Velocimicrobium porci]MSS64709.1 hypothetical protein [Velocimicrobium porci]
MKKIFFKRAVVFLLIFSIMMGIFPEMVTGKQKEDDLQRENIVETDKININETANESEEDIVASGAAISSRTKRATSEQLLLKTRVYVYVKPDSTNSQNGIINEHKYFTVGYISLDLPIADYSKYPSENGDKTLSEYKDSIDEALKNLKYEHNKWLEKCTIDWYTLHVSDGADHYVSSGSSEWHLDGTVKAEEIPEIYNITYDANDGSRKTYNDIDSYKKGEEVTVKGKDEVGFTTPEKKKFIGWSMEKDGSDKLYQQGETFAVEKNVTLYAQWETIKTAKIKVKEIYLDESKENKQTEVIKEAEVLAGEDYSINFQYEHDGKTDWEIDSKKEKGICVTSLDNASQKTKYDLKKDEKEKPVGLSFKTIENKDMSYEVIIRYKRAEQKTVETKVYAYVRPTGIDKEKEGILNGHKYFTVGHITVDMPVPEFHKEAYSHKNGKKTLEQYDARVKEALKNLKYEHNAWLKDCNINWYSLHVDNGADNYVPTGKPAWHLDGEVKVKDLPSLYKVTYDENNEKADKNKIYEDSNLYVENQDVTIMDNNKTGFHVDGKKFLGWTTDKKGKGKLYQAEEKFAIKENTRFYAKWEEETPEKEEKPEKPETPEKPATPEKPEETIPTPEKKDDGVPDVKKPEPTSPVQIPDSKTPLTEMPNPGNETVKIPDEKVPLTEEPKTDMETVDIPDEEVPLTEKPKTDLETVEIPDEKVPLAKTPEKKLKTVDIPEEEVPLANNMKKRSRLKDKSERVENEEGFVSDVAKTGDNIMIWFLGTIISFLGFALIVWNEKKAKKDF